jgi:hypothetical protein
MFNFMALIEVSVVPLRVFLSPPVVEERIDQVLRYRGLEAFD